MKMSRYFAFLVVVATLSGLLIAQDNHEHKHVDSKATSTHPIARAIRSGNWSDVGSWESGHLPKSGDNVLITAGIQIRYDVNSAEVIRVLKIAGILDFATDRNTELNVGLIRIEDGEDVSEEGFDCDLMPSQYGHESLHHHHEHHLAKKPALQVGSAIKPVGERFTAKIRLTYCDGMDAESCPAIVCCGGRMDFHGAAMNRTWIKMAENAKAESREIELSETPKGWQAGHRVVIPTTDRVFLFKVGNQGLIKSSRDDTQTEERTIIRIEGDKIELDRALEYEHVGEQPFGGEVGNLSRNVIVESADPQGKRGHTMYHYGSSGSISYAEFRNLGKRGVLGRYPIHYHLCRDTMRGSSIVGASIHDSDNRWLTIHGTDYVVVRDCIGYNSLGHGYFLEDGTEVFNVFDHNLAIQALHAAPLPKQVLPYDENEGAGFWWANSLNAFMRNNAVECDQYGYRFEATAENGFTPVLDVPQANSEFKSVDIRTLPFVRFEDNEAHSQRRFAINLGGIRHVSDAEDYKRIHTPGSDLSRIQGGDVGRVGPDSQHPFVIKNTRIWNCHWVFHGGSPNVLINGLQAADCTYGIFKTRMDGHEYRRLNMQRIDTADIFEPWGNTTIQEDYHRYLDPQDDLAPTSVITKCEWIDPQHLRVEGCSIDNNEIDSVEVNNHSVKPISDDYSQWEVVLDIEPDSEPVTLQAIAKDTKDNSEVSGHRVTLDPL